MEKTLRSLFDYHRFENNPRLAKLIAESETRFSEALSDDALGLVNAAGGIDSGYETDYSKKGFEPAPPTDAGTYSADLSGR